VGDTLREAASALFTFSTAVIDSALNVAEALHNAEILLFQLVEITFFRAD
jgi:hypothetical protein